MRFRIHTHLVLLWFCVYDTASEQPVIPESQRQRQDVLLKNKQQEQQKSGTLLGAFW